MTSLRQVQIVTESYVLHKIFSVVSIVEFNINNGKNSMLTTPGMSKVMTSTFISDTARLWNKAPDIIKKSDILFSAKKNIRKFDSTLPI